MVTKFQDSKIARAIVSRKGEWVRDLNMNIITGKVIKSTHYFGEID